MTDDELIQKLYFRPALLHKIGAAFQIGSAVGVMVGLGVSEKEIRDTFENALKNANSALPNELKKS